MTTGEKQQGLNVRQHSGSCLRCQSSCHNIQLWFNSEDERPSSVSLLSELTSAQPTASMIRKKVFQLKETWVAEEEDLGKEMKERESGKSWNLPVNLLEHKRCPTTLWEETNKGLRWKYILDQHALWNQTLDILLCVYLCLWVTFGHPAPSSELWVWEACLASRQRSDQTFHTACSRRTETSLGKTNSVWHKKEVDIIYISSSNY